MLFKHCNLHQNLVFISDKMCASKVVDLLHLFLTLFALLCQAMERQDFLWTHEGFIFEGLFQTKYTDYRDETVARCSSR